MLMRELRLLEMNSLHQNYRIAKCQDIQNVFTDTMEFFTCEENSLMLEVWVLVLEDK